MGNEFTGFEDNAPTLTLEPDLGESKAEVAAEPEAEAVKKEMEQTVLSPEEQQMVDSFAKKIDIENTNQILQYGAGTQKKMADFSDAALENVRTQDLGEVGDLITQVVGELRDFDAAEEEKGFLGFFKKQGSKIENMKNRYAKAEVNVQKITTSLQDHQMRLMKDSAVLEKMYAQNLNYYKELTMYILAGKQKLQEVREGKLKDLEAKAAVSGLPEEAQEAKDLDSKAALRATDYPAYIIAHKQVVTDRAELSALIDSNIAFIHRKERELLDDLTDGMTFSDWIYAFCQRENIRTRQELKFSIVERNFANFTDWLTDTGKVRVQRDFCAKRYYHA